MVRTFTGKTTACNHLKNTVHIRLDYLLNGFFAVCVFSPSAEMEKLGRKLDAIAKQIKSRRQGTTAEEET